jgi:hypothetical protein
MGHLIAGEFPETRLKQTKNWGNDSLTSVLNYTLPKLDATYQR